jgi:AcrR family transcriptional regulator
MHQRWHEEHGPPRRRRGRPRSQAVERAIIEGVLHLLEEGVPLGELSIERVARTAGVGKATIYRRWPGKDALLVDALRAIEEPIPPLPGTSVRDDLVTLLDFLRRLGLAKCSSTLLRTVVAQFQRSPELWDRYFETVVLARRNAVYEVLRRGMRNGDIRDDLDLELLNDLFTGPMLARTVLRPEATLEEGLAERIVDTVLAGVRPPRG